MPRHDDEGGGLGVNTGHGSCGYLNGLRFCFSRMVDMWREGRQSQWTSCLVPLSRCDAAYRLIAGRHILRFARR